MEKRRSDEFWYDDFSILFLPERIMEFFPVEQYNTSEKLNAVTRLAFYLSVLLFFYHKNVNVFYIFVLTLFGTYYIYKTLKDNGGSVENLESVDKDKVDCTRPTLDNPFMNVTMKDYMNIKDGAIVERPPICDLSSPKIQGEIDETFSNNLYKNVDDIFGRMNSQRQFYTMPSTTIPNKQDEFARWLYASPKTCKENQDNCLRYEDLRAKRPVFYDANVNPNKVNKQ